MTRLQHKNVVIGCGVPPWRLLWWALFGPREPADQLTKGHELLLGASCLRLAALAARGWLWPSVFVQTNMVAGYSTFSVPPWFQILTFSGAVSSFPSDHAALLYALAVGILFVSRPLGGWPLAG